MKSFFDGVRRHIGNMDAEHLREQYRRLSDEVSSYSAWTRRTPFKCWRYLTASHPSEKST